LYELAGIDHLIKSLIDRDIKNIEFVTNPKTGQIGLSYVDNLNPPMYYETKITHWLQPVD